MRDYYRRTYVVDRPYMGQKGFETSRPQTDVKQITPVAKYESPVSYKPYGSQSYHEMMYLFPGYEGVRRKWFDSVVGGQGSDLKEYVTKQAMPFPHMIQRTDGDWPTARDTLAGETIYFTSSGQVNCTVGNDAGTYTCQRIFIGFDLRNVHLKGVNSCYLGCYGSYPSALTYTSISVQESSYNPFLYPTNLTHYSYFKGSPFAIKRFTGGWNLMDLGRNGRAYVKSRYGKWLSFCIREYNYDYKNIAPGAASTYTNAMFVESIRLFINHKGKEVIISPSTNTSGSGGGQKLIPA